MAPWVDIFYVILGAIISIVITAVIEMKRMPSLELKIENHDLAHYDDNHHPAKIAKFLYVVVENKELPPLMKWLSRNGAMQCHGTITFHHLDGTNVFQHPMPIRWTSLPIPEVEQVLFDDKVFQVIDMNKVNHYSRVDIYPGGVKESLNIAARFDDDEDCYGWTNENFVSSPLWRTYRWKLAKGRYLVKVCIFSSGEKCEELFRLINDVSISDFRLEPVLENDRVIE